MDSAFSKYFKTSEIAVAAPGVSSKSADHVSPSRDMSRAPLKLTPLEAQVFDLRLAHPGCILFVECGYRFRFFGEDAVIAADCLSLVAHRQHSSIVCSIPTYRVLIHAKKLLAGGHKIAIVRQTETALSRKRKRAQGAPATAAQPFNRDVVAVFTPGTGISADHPCVSDLLRSESNDSCRCISAVDTDVLQGANMETDEATWVVAVHEERVDRQPFYSYGVVAVSLDHCLLRHQYLEGDLNLTRLTHLLDIIKPSELIVKSAAGSTTTDSLMCIFPGVCVETVNAEVQLNLEDFVNILSFSPQEQKALILICNYISEFAVLQPMGNYISSLIKGLSIENWSGTRNFFGCDSNLTFNELSDTFEIDEITTGDLSLFTNRVDKTLGKILSHGSEKKTKSLFELINNCKTSYGKRRLSMWLLNPLKNISIIKSRQSAVSWLLDHSDEAYILKDQWTKELNIIFLRSRGFDTQLAPLRRHTALCSPLGMYRILLFCRSLPPFSALTKQLCQWSVSHNFVLPELIFLIYPFKTIESIGYVADIFFSYLHKDEANGRVSLSNQYLAKETELRRFECQVQSLKQELDLILFSLRKNLESPGLVFKTLKKCTSSNSQTYHDYLIEVDNRDKQMLSRIPTGWVFISCTKTVRRYHLPEIDHVVSALREAENDYEFNLKCVWNEFVAHCAIELLPQIDIVVNYLADIDCLQSLSRLGLLPGYIQPTIIDHHDKVCLRNARHPLIEQILLEKDVQTTYIPNDVDIGFNYGERRAQLLSGPNMGGKSCFAKMVALNCLMAQIGAHIPAESAELCIFDRISTVICGRSVDENIYVSGLSSFAMEMYRLSNILKCCTSRSLVIMDEVGRGTSANEGCAIAAATVKYIARNVGCALIFISHFSRISDLTTVAGLVNIHVEYCLQCRVIDQIGDDFSNSCVGGETNLRNEIVPGAESKQFLEDPCDDVPNDKNVITYLYTIGDGSAPDAYGLYVAALAGLDSKILNHAAHVAKTLTSKFEYDYFSS